MTTEPSSILIDSGSDDAPDREQLIEQITVDQFTTWHRRKKWRENIENGQPYFNGTGSIPDPERHSPSSLLQCHRKVTYRQLNAPEEQGDPQGIFWFGTKFEEELALPFLQETVSDEGAFVSNSLWVDYTVHTPAGDVQIKGSTDPVIVDADGMPILPTEIKTKSSVDDVDEPNRHHLAQVHAYIVGLNEKHDCDISQAVLIYGARKSLDVAVFHVEFDHEFWEETVLKWASAHTQYRLDETLPPANPEYDWECRFCDYRHRCGQSNRDYVDFDPHGFLPEFTGYPRSKVIEYLQAHPDQSMTPALARTYPDLAEIYDVFDWYCSTCDSTVDWETVDDAVDPLCPRCAERNRLSSLSLPIRDSYPSCKASASEHSQQP